MCGLCQLKSDEIRNTRPLESEAGERIALLAEGGNGPLAVPAARPPERAHADPGEWDAKAVLTELAQRR